MFSSVNLWVNEKVSHVGSKQTWVKIRFFFFFKFECHTILRRQQKKTQKILLKASVFFCSLYIWNWFRKGWGESEIFIILYKRGTILFFIYQAKLYQSNSKPRWSWVAKKKKKKLKRSWQVIKKSTQRRWFENLD